MSIFNFITFIVDNILGIITVLSNGRSCEFITGYGISLMPKVNKRDVLVLI